MTFRLSGAARLHEWAATSPPVEARRAVKAFLDELLEKPTENQASAVPLPGTPLPVFVSFPASADVAVTWLLVAQYHVVHLIAVESLHQN